MLMVRILICVMVRMAGIMLLIYTQSGVFASVVTYDLQDGNAPMFKGVGMLENGSLVLEDYSFDVGRHGEDTRYFGYGSQPLV